ncbi:MAG: hypothetical protein EOO01_31510 [Chitinophagaceae bacterium]|nr:MAG: hypothetical protein EOO01_31510 [Chitinophagaceae bacterium]
MKSYCTRYCVALFILLSVFCVRNLKAQKLVVQSPDKKNSVALYIEDEGGQSQLYLKVSRTDSGKTNEIIPQISLGLKRSDHDFFNDLKFLKAGKQKLVSENYTAPHGKKALCTNSANEIVASFANSAKSKLNIIIRAYNDGIAFRYEFPEKGGNYKILDELTTYTIPKQTKRWMEKWNPANEGLYTVMSGDKVQKQEWCYPALFQANNSSWYLLHEADLNASYCGTKLSNIADSDRYKLSFPNQGDGRGQGSSIPNISLPWKSPWRTLTAHC